MSDEYLQMIELNDFYNAGFGWICKQCESGRTKTATDDKEGRARHFSEGEAESKTPRMSTGALARWADPLHQILTCPRCGITEPVEKR